MEKLEVKVINNSFNNELPKYETNHSAGMDLRANEDVIIGPGNWKLIKTGLSIQLPVGYEAQIRSRSGLALKNGVVVLNAPGTIDSDYRGEVGIILINHGISEFEVKAGERIAQMIISKCEQIQWEVVEKLDETNRGSGGYGHTGK